MGIATAVSEQEYLHSSYDPDCELVDGNLLDRNVGEREHSIIQGELIIYFGTRRKEWGVQDFPAQRIRLGPGHYRVPDVCVYREPAPREQVFTTPPFLAIEILSSEDRMSRVRRKIDDYLHFGVAYVWVIDPDTRKADVYTAASIYEAKDQRLRTENPEMEIPLAELFRALDE
ncbi:MAG: Uma2 family endonuclease [Bryobacteraceae bacterium]|nr:Uma2 family endonuclease [Bryobacteraceae bacterium]